MSRSEAALNPCARPHALVAFDVDGTLIHNADGKVIWQLLNRRFGGDEQINAQRYRSYLNHEISYAQWVDLDVGEWVEAAATREQIAEVIHHELQLVSGAREAISTLRQRGYRLAVISGTLDITLELLFPDHPFEEVFTNQIWFSESGTIAGWQATPYDMEGKAQALIEIAERMDIPLCATVFVGDNINDLQVMNQAGLAIAFEPKHPTVSAAADVILQDDLRQILDVLR